MSKDLSKTAGKLKAKTALADLDHSHCVLNNLHKTARALNRVYAQEMRPTKLGRSQFTILSTLGQAGPCSISAFAALMQIDRSTLTRNLYPLERGGLVIRTESEDDARRVLVTLTSKGERRLAAAQAYWQQAQNKVVAAFGAERWRKLEAELSALRRLQNL